MVSLLFGLKGRINRAQYWLGVSIAGVGGMVLFFLLAAMTLPAGNFAKGTVDSVAALHLISSMGVSFGLPLVLMGWIGSALQVKRFHDRGRSGLWALAPMVPAFMLMSSIVGGLLTGAHPEHIASSAGLWFILLQVVQLVMFVDLGCMPGKAEANKYGNPPGGGLGGGGAPAGGVTGPSQPSRASTSPVPGMGSTLTSAESAIDRAIAEQRKQSPAAASPASLGPRPAAQPAAGLRPATAGSFGRRASR